MTPNSLSLSPMNSTIVRVSSALQRTLWRGYFRVASHVLPGVARRQAEHLFTTPPRAARTTTLPAPARRETVASRSGDLAVWQAGPADAPAVLLVHGWGGVGEQLGAFVAPLLAKGHRVIWFDQPGHGASGRQRVGLPDLVGAVEAIEAACGPVTAAIGHSLGAAAALLALRQGWPLQRVALIGAPTSMTEHLHGFARLLGLPPAIREAIRNRLEARYAIRLSEIDRLDILSGITLPTLVLHDVNDRQIRFEHATRLVAHLPNARLLRTHGLGHFRILRDPAVVRTVVNFISGSKASPPSDLPELPDPAPLY